MTGTISQDEHERLRALEPMMHPQLVAGMGNHKRSAALRPWRGRLGRVHLISDLI